MNVIRITACRLCESAALELVVSFQPTPPGDRYLTADKWQDDQPCYPLDVLCCRDCGAVQLADTVDPALIYPEYLYTTSVSKGLAEHFASYARDVVKRLMPAVDALVVDVGSNDGTLLRQFETYGCRVLGVDPAETIAAHATAAGINTHCAFFGEQVAWELQAAHGQAYLITANHVFANVADLHDFTNGVKHLLAPHGTFVFETGYWPAIVDCKLIDTIEHEHIHYFAAAPLQQFFTKHGLTLVHVEQNTMKGGSLRGYVQHTGAKADETVAQMIAAEEAGGYTDPILLASWANELKTLEHEMRALIAASAGETWVGYGAAVGSTLLLHQFGLGERLRCLVDANPAKVGRLSPGYNLIVHDPSELAKLQPDRIVILAWRYAELIQQQHPEFAGKFLIPLPQMVGA
jgi:hypothetical protein